MRDIRSTQVVNVHFIDPQELQAGLMYLAGALPHEPRWIVLVTVGGDLAAHYRGKNAGDDVAAMLKLLERQSGALANALGNGNLRWTMSVAEAGTCLIMLLGNAYLVGINLGGVKSYDQVVKAATEGVVPLMDMLGVSAT